MLTTDFVQQEKRKTINGEDILWAMNALGFENYVEPLKIYLQKFREVRRVYVVKFVEEFRRGVFYCTYIVVCHFSLTL